MTDCLILPLTNIKMPYRKNRFVYNILSCNYQPIFARGWRRQLTEDKLSVALVFSRYNAIGFMHICQKPGSLRQWVLQGDISLSVRARSVREWRQSFMYQIRWMQPILVNHKIKWALCSIVVCAASVNVKCLSSTRVIVMVNSTCRSAVTFMTWRT